MPKVTQLAKRGKARFQSQSPKSMLLLSYYYATVTPALGKM